jgi:hypothetical protein
MKAHPRMLGEEALDVFGLVRGEVVEHDVNLLRPARALHQPFQERNELLAGVPGPSVLKSRIPQSRST